MARKSKIIIAVTNNLAALNLDTDQTRKLFAEIHHWSPDGVNHIIVADAHNWRVLSDYFSTHGAIVAPSHHDHISQVGPTFAALIPSAHGVVPSDSTWSAAAKIARAGWPAIDPVEF